MKDTPSFNKKKKLLRFYKIYGFSRTYVKIAGRLRKNILPFRFPITFFNKREKNIAIIGCGQFAFATIAYFLKSMYGYVIYGVFDIDNENSKTLSSYYKCKLFPDYISLLNSEAVKYVYIASNHATHSFYAVEALKRDKVVYIEKPISVNEKQYLALLKAAEGKKVFVGYNRPFAPAITVVKKHLSTSKHEKRTPLTINQFIIGHKIPLDHWYRDPEEGTRVCGNIGHWLDLSIHLLTIIGLPKELKVSIISSSEIEKDDNLSITIISDLGDLISITLSSREEPFEGINESINIQYSHLIAKIDDFRRLTLWNGDEVLKKRYFRKDVGHKNAINQPFDNANARNFKEVMISTKLMLDITEAVKTGKKEILFQV